MLVRLPSPYPHIATSSDCHAGSARASRRWRLASFLGCWSPTAARAKPPPVSPPSSDRFRQSLETPPPEFGVGSRLLGPQGMPFPPLRRLLQRWRSPMDRRGLVGPALPDDTTAPRGFIEGDVGAQASRPPGSGGSHPRRPPLPQCFVTVQTGAPMDGCPLSRLIVRPRPALTGTTIPPFELPLDRCTRVQLRQAFGSAVQPSQCRNELVDRRCLKKRCPALRPGLHRDGAEVNRRPPLHVRAKSHIRPRFRTHGIRPRWSRRRPENTTWINFDSSAFGAATTLVCPRPSVPAMPSGSGRPITLVARRAEAGSLLPQALRTRGDCETPRVLPGVPVAAKCVCASRMLQMVIEEDGCCDYRYQ